MIPNFKVLGHRVTFQVRSMTRKPGTSGPVRKLQIVAAMWFSRVLITNIVLVLIRDDVFKHLDQVGSGQVRSTGRGCDGYS